MEGIIPDHEFEDALNSLRKDFKFWDTSKKKIFLNSDLSNMDRERMRREELESSDGNTCDIHDQVIRIPKIETEFLINYGLSIP